MENKTNTFKVLNAINVNEKTEKKNGLTYLSWSWAWSEIKKQYPLANYKIIYTDGKPYLFDENLGYLITTEVTIENETLSMFLPVMDGANKAMKNKPYNYTTKWGEKTCEAASMFDINKTIMRCLVKNLAMFGLGIYIYAGEDLPESIEEVKIKQTPKQAPKKKVLGAADKVNFDKIVKWAVENKCTFDYITSLYDMDAKTAELMKTNIAKK